MHSNEIFIESGWKFAMSVSGGGQEVIGDLTKHGGMSNTLLQATVPYSSPAYCKLIGGVPDQIVSPAAARAAAMVCYQQAKAYAPDYPDVFGFASTGAVVKIGGEREGREHRVCMCLQMPDRTIGINLVYGPGRERLEEESLTAKCILEALKWGCHRFADVSMQLDKDRGDTIHVESKVAKPWLVDLLHGVTEKDPYVSSRAIFSSSFNPMHDAHINIINDAARRLGNPIDLELCIRNADKPPLDYKTIDERVDAINSGYACDNNLNVGILFLTNKPMFFDKAKLFTGATFVVGMDTFDRILDEKYYRRGGDDVLLGLTDMSATGNRFLVYPRKGYEPLVRNMDSVEGSLIGKVTTFVSAFDGYEESDISSTTLRKGQKP